MTRLTKQIRENIANELLNRRFKERGGVLATRSDELFQRVYNDHYDAETQRLMKRLKAKYRDAFHHYGTIECRAPGGLRVSIGRAQIGSSSVGWRGTTEQHPFLLNDRDSRNWAYTDCEIGEALTSFATDQAALVTEIKSANAELIGALNTLTTVKQLEELWPDVIDIALKHVPVPSGSNLPAVQFAKLSTSFGLTSAEGGAA